MSNRQSHTRSGNRGDAPPSGDDGEAHLLTLGGLTVVATSVLGSVLGHSMLPAQVRIHWTLGFGPYYGPEFAPKLVVLVLFPVLTLGVALVGRLFVLRVRASDAFADVRPYDTLTVIGVVLLLVGVQTALILVNI